MRGERPRDEGAFHEGEVALQREAGVSERMHRLGPQIMRASLPEQHRRFFPLLPFIVVGSVDERGQPTASLLGGPPGFVHSPDPESLRIDALPAQGDPLDRNLQVGTSLGLLGIQLHTRRRNRVNGSVLTRDEVGFSLEVDQSFGNCPKYIQPREVVYLGSDEPGEASVAAGLSAPQRALVEAADTFYLASAHPEAPASVTPSHGVDVSHRGGPPGFAHFTDDSSFIIPDFRGNNLYNTLGNLQLNRLAGLLFVDPVQGHLLQIEASAELLHGSHPLAHPEGTGRIVRCRVLQTRWFPRASPLRFSALLEAPPLIEL